VLKTGAADSPPNRNAVAVCATLRRFEVSGCRPAFFRHQPATPSAHASVHAAAAGAAAGQRRKSAAQPPERLHATSADRKCAHAFAALSSFASALYRATRQVRDSGRRIESDAANTHAQIARGALSSPCLF